jgi:16S rRNA (cytosine1402-N4)-methyltransferase
MYRHIPVMLKEVLKVLEPKSGEIMIDGTLGGGGYTRALAEKVGPTGKVLGIDLDKLAIANAKKFIKEQDLHNIKLVQGNFGDLEAIVPAHFKKVDGIVLDLGLSSAQLDDPRRGFSFLRHAPVNMGFGDETKEDTSVILNKYRAEDLAKIIKEYGEEKFANSIAKKIIEARPIKDTAELLEAIGRGIPAAAKRQSKIHWATKTFQALRIATNRELESLEKFLPQAVKLLKPNGRLAIVSFHSLEDRIVKNYFRQEAKDCLCPPQLPICVCGHKAKIKIITKNALVASEAEVKDNPRARSAKLRAIQKI